MFVRTLIGRNAGQIQEQPYHAATANLANGTALPVTEDEIREAGIDAPRALSSSVEKMPEGYRVADDEEEGFNVFAPDGKEIRKTPFKNLAEARAAANAHAADTAKAHAKANAKQ